MVLLFAQPTRLLSRCGASPDASTMRLPMSLRFLVVKAAMLHLDFPFFATEAVSMVFPFAVVVAELPKGFGTPLQEVLSSVSAAFRISVECSLTPCGAQIAIA